jgi:hypothetical protein
MRTVQCTEIIIYICFTETCDALPRNLGDGFCDDEANNEECEFDKGDCCLLDAKSKDYCDECICKERKEPETCEISPRILGDSVCDDEANNEACEFDKGDCCLSDTESKKYCEECMCKERKEQETCEVSPRILGDGVCDDRANIEACEFDKGDCCLLDIKSKNFCKECLCKVSKTEDSKYTAEYCGRRPGERDTSFSFTNGASISPTKVNTVNFRFKHVGFKEVFRFKEEFHCSQNFRT